MPNSSKAQHFEVLFIGRELTTDELREVIGAGLEATYTGVEEWQLEVAELEDEDAHLA